MKTFNAAMAAWLLGCLLVGVVAAQETTGVDLPQPWSMRRAALGYDSYLYFIPPEGASDPAYDAAQGTNPTASGQTDCACPEQSSCQASQRCAGCGPWTLPQPCFLKSRQITLGGWLDQGVTLNSRWPADRFNGLVTFNDRNAEYQMNQLYLYLKRDVNNQGCGWGWGVRADVLYGTDARFTQAIDGLERNWHQTERFYQLALPQFYLDVAYNDFTLRMGHFYTIIGQEVVTAPDNFFYSHTYTHQYGEPFTHTGLLGMYKLNDHWSFSGGLHRGNDKFDDALDGHDSLGFLGGVTWTPSERLKYTFAITASEEGVGNTTTIYSSIAAVQLSRKLKWIIEHDYGQSVGPGPRAQWYGLENYWSYELSDRWAAGLRFEWFRDNDGSRVTGLGSGNVLNDGTFFRGNFYALTAGLNWKLNPNVRVRPEVRWDWSNATNGSGLKPFDAGTRSDQFLTDLDVIVTF